MKSRAQTVANVTTTAAPLIISLGRLFAIASLDFRVTGVTNVPMMLFAKMMANVSKMKVDTFDAAVQQDIMDQPANSGL